MQPTETTTDVAVHNWMAFTPDHDPEDARKCFKERYNKDPQMAVIIANILLVGPIPHDRGFRLQ